MHDDTKYLVFKREEFLSWLYGPTTVVPEPRWETMPMLEDAVVIRRQDVFAPPAFDAYSNSILTAVETLNGQADPATVERLTSIADFFHEQAALAWTTDRKLPD